jgi:hypothetical protein
MLPGNGALVLESCYYINFPLTNMPKYQYTNYEYYNTQVTK